MYAGIIIMWIVLPVFIATWGFISTYIIDGTCIPFGVNRSDDEKRAKIAVGIFVFYLLPMMIMVFCYSRIVYALKNKVSAMFDN